MPVGEQGFTTTYGEEQKRKRQPLQAPPEIPQNPTAHKLSLVEHHSAGTFPTQVSWALSNLDLQDRQMARLSKVLAHQFDVKPHFVFGQTNPSKMVDPYTGEVGMSHRTVMRLTNNFAPLAVESMLKNVLVPTGHEVAVRRGRSVTQYTAPPKTGRIVDFAREVGRSIPNDSLKVTQGLGIALYLAKQKGLSPEKFGVNFRQVLGWKDATNQPISTSEAVSMAMEATQQHKTFHSFVDVVDFIAPPNLKGASASELAAPAAQPDALYPQNPAAPPRQLYGTTATAKPSATYQLNQFEQTYAYTQNAPDIFAEAKALEDKINMDQTAFQRSWLGRNVIIPLGETWSKAWRLVEEGLVDAATPISAALRGATSPLSGSDFKTEWNKSYNWRDHVFSGLQNGETLGQVFAEDAHLSPALGNIADFALSWYLDPTVLLGKGLGAARAARMLPGLEEGESLFGRLTSGTISQVPGGASFLKGRALAKDQKAFELWGGYSVKFAESRTTKGLFDAIYDTKKGIGGYLQKIENLRSYHNASQPLDYAYMKALRDKLLEKYPTKSAEALKEFQTGVKAHFWGFGPEGSVANEAWKTYSGLRKTTEETLIAAENIRGARYAPHDSGLLVPEATAHDLSNEVLQLPDQHLPLTAEIPSMGLTTLGPRRLARRALNSDFVTASALGKRTDRLFSYNPGRILQFHEAPDVYGLLHAKRWATFTESESRVWQSRLLEAVNGGPGFEARVEMVMNQLDEEGFARYLKKRYAGKLSPEAETELQQQIFEPVRSANYKMRAFGVVPDIGPEGEAFDRIITDPIVETNLKNTYIVADPIQVQAQVDRYIGASRRAMSHLRSVFGKTSPEITAAIDTALAKGLIKGEDMAAPFGRAYRRMWKGLTVARPGYIPRVILTDENARFLVDSGSLSDRLLSQRWSAVDAQTTVGKAFGKQFSHVSGYLDKHGFFDETIHGLRDPLTGEDLVLPRAGAAAIDYEPLASQQLRNTQLLEDMLTDAKKVNGRMRDAGSWDSVVPSQPGYSKAWAHALKHQLANSDPGLIALESVAAGRTIAETEKELLAWARQDGNRTLRSLGHGTEDAKQWASDLAGMTHSYTMGDKAIAEAAINRVDDLEAKLKSIKNYKTNDAGEVLNTDGTAWKRYDKYTGKTSYVGDPAFITPTVHGPSIDFLTGSSQDVLHPFVSKLYKDFVTMPEDVLNRQPFYRVWKRRAERGYAKVLSQAGVTELTPELRQSMDVASRSFALEQVKATMFEFTKQSRFTELLSTVFPFPQPFFEGFQVWARLAVHHPEAIGRAKALFNLGVDSGFIKKTPDGEYVVPMGVYQRMAGLVTAINSDWRPKDWENYSFFASLNSFNMLSQSTVTIPGGNNLISRLVGGMPIPVPGFDPVARLVLQRMLRNRPSDDMLASLVYQFGPASAASIIPSSVKRVLTAFAPEAFGGGAIDAMTKHVLRSYQVNGLDKDENGKPLPASELAARAKQDAEDILGIAGITSMFSPAALRVKDPGTDLQNELTSLIDKLGPSDGMGAFLKTHPNQTLFAVSQTYFSGYDPSKYGEDRPAPRVPASQFAWDLLHSPNVEPLIREHPEWAALLLIGLDPNVTQKYDFGVYSRMLASHFLSSKDSAKFWTEGENSTAWEEVNKYYKAVVPGQMRFAETHGISTDDVAYTTNIVLPRQQMLTHLAQQFPEWAKDHLVQNTDTGMWDWAGFTATDFPPEIILHDARQIAAMPGFGHFPGVVALNAYLEGRDKIKGQMDKLGIVDITSQDAQDAGLTKKYDSLISSIENGKAIETAQGKPIDQTEGYPDFSPFINSFFRGDLTSNVSPKTVFLANIPSPERQSVTALDVAYNTLKKNNKTYDTTAQQFQGYQDVRDFWAKANPEAVKTWLDAVYATPGKLQDERAYLAGLPSVFYSDVDWKLMGVNLNKQASNWMGQIGQARVDIEKLYEDRLTTNNPYSKGDGYKAIDAWVKQHLGKKNKGFDEAIKATNTWGWGVVSAGLTDKPGRAGQLWSKMVSNAQYIQAQADQRQMNGKSYDTDENQRLYASAQKQLLALAKSYMGRSGEFKQQWYDLQTQLSPSGGLITIFMPEDYFPLGGFGHYLRLSEVKAA